MTTRFRLTRQASFAGLALLLLAGCTDLRRAVGLERSSPDEYQVLTNAPLTLPPDYDLRPPRPGEPSAPAQRAVSPVDPNAIARSDEAAAAAAASRQAPPAATATATLGTTGTAEPRSPDNATAEEILRQANTGQTGGQR